MKVWKNRRSAWLEHAALFLSCMSFALINGFPFYSPDSANYAGFLPEINTLRSPIAGLTAFPLYQLVGPWALPVINSIAVSYFIIRFFLVFFDRPPPLVAVVVLLFAASVPVLTAFIMPDIWFLVMVLALVLLLTRWSNLDFAIAALAAASHSMNLLILVTLMPVALLLWPERTRTVRLFLYCAATSLLLLIAGNFAISGRLFPDTIAWSIVASKMLNDVPESVESLCAADATSPICSKRNMLIGNTFGDDDHFVWFSDLSWQTTGGLSRWEFNQTGRQLLVHAIASHPKKLIMESLRDWFRAFNPSRCFGSVYTTVEGSTLENAFLENADTGWLTRTGYFTSPSFCIPTYVLNILLMGAALGACVLCAHVFDHKARGLIVFLCAAIVINDLLFAFLSGMGGRYTVRSYGLLAVVFLIALMSDRARGFDSARVNPQPETRV